MFFFFFSNYAFAKISPGRCFRYFRACDIARNVADDFSISPFGKVDSPGSCIRLSFSGKQFLSDKLLLRARRRSFRRRLHGVCKNRGCFAAPPPPRHYVTPARCFVRRCGGSGARSEGSRMAEKVDQYQAKRSAPTNLCGDPSNDTSRSRYSRIDFADPTPTAKKKKKIRNNPVESHRDSSLRMHTYVCQ